MITGLARLDTRLIAKLDELALILRNARYCRTPQEVAGLLEGLIQQAEKIEIAAAAMADLQTGEPMAKWFEQQQHAIIAAILGPMPQAVIS